MIKLFGNRLDYLHEKFVINEKRKQAKNTRDNRIHKEGFDAGVLKERKRITKIIKSLEYCKFYIGKNPADKRYKVYLKSEIDETLDNL